MADFAVITARVATGAAITSAADVQALLAAGVTHILDVTSDEDDTQWLSGFGVPYLYNPTPDDGSQKPPSWWQASLAFAQQAYATLGTCVYAHCSAGRNRGPSTAYAIMRACAGLDAAEARALIVAARPQVGLAYAAQFDAWWAEANPGKAVAP